MNRYETVEMKYEQTEDLDEQLFKLRLRGWFYRGSRNFKQENGVFSEWATFEVYDD